MDPAIEKFILHLPKEKQKVALHVREVMLAAHPKVTEAIKWNNLTFLYGKTNLAFVYTYESADYMNLGFMKATSLTDPKKLFEGTGKGMRHIKIKTTKDIPAAQIKKWVKEAISLEE